MATQRTGVLIVGGGQAGAMAAASLRGFGYTERILVVGTETTPPYERPPLSKAMLSGAIDVGQLLIHPTGFHAEKAIDLVLGRHVVALAPEAHMAQLDNGDQIVFKKCLIATGGKARAVPSLPAGGPRVHYLRSMADAIRLREELRQVQSVLVVGAGFLGLEIASTARSMGLAVQVLEGADRVLPRVLPPQASAWLEARIASAGVSLHTKTRCQSFHVGATDVTATLDSGQAISADIVVVAVGLEPEVGIARDAAMALHPANGGIRVDARCATSVADIYAAGDCTSQLHPFLGAEVRLESWQNANEQARLAAAAMAEVATDDLAAPWFWSDQFDINLQVIGVPRPELSYHCRGDMRPSAEAPKFLLLGTDASGRILHAIAVNAGGDLRQLKGLVDGRTSCDATRLCDASAPLRQLVRAATSAHASASIS